MDYTQPTDASTLLAESRQIISDLRSLVLSIHKAKQIKQTKDLPLLITRKDDLILLMRYKSRELQIVSPT